MHLSFVALLRKCQYLSAILEGWKNRIIYTVKSSKTTLLPDSELAQDMTPFHVNFNKTCRQKLLLMIFHAWWNSKHDRHFAITDSRQNRPISGNAAAQGKAGLHDLPDLSAWHCQRPNRTCILTPNSQPIH